MEKKASYNVSADIIRVLAIFGVVTIHVVNAIYPRLDYFGGKVWWISIILDSLFRISIPLFIMLSGYFILDKDESVRESFKRAYTKIFIPLIAAVAFYSYWRYGKPYIGEINISLISKLFFVNVYDFYFLVILLGLYVMAPFLRAYLQKSSEKEHWFLMKFFLILGSTEVLLQYVFHFCATNFFTQWIPYTGLFLAGYILGKGVIKKQIPQTRLLILYTGMLILTIALNYIYYYLATLHITFLSPKGCLSQYFDNYLSINVVIMSLCAFLLLMQARFIFIQKHTVLSKSIYSVARAAFGIYIVHLVVARFLELQFLLAVDFTSLPMLLFLPIRLGAVFLLSYLLTLVLGKIPGVKRLVGYI